MALSAFEMDDNEINACMTLMFHSCVVPAGKEWSTMMRMINKGWVHWDSKRSKYEMTEAGFRKYFARRNREPDIKAAEKIVSMQRGRHVPVTATSTLPVVQCEPRPFKQEVTIRETTKPFRKNVWTMDEWIKQEDKDRKEREEQMQQMLEMWD